jgi:hypothetical protein
MDDILLYLLRVSAGMIALYLFFLLFNRRDTFYNSNRIILLLSLIVPVVFPLLNISQSQSDGRLAAPQVFLTIANAAGSAGINPEITGRYGSTGIIIFLSWLTVSILILVKMLISFFRFPDKKRLSQTCSHKRKSSPIFFLSICCNPSAPL